MTVLIAIKEKVLRPAIITIFFLTILSGCVTKEARKDISDEEILKERVMTYWAYRIQKELDKTYIFEYPLYRKQVTLAKYIKRFDDPSIKFNRADVISIEKRENGVAEVQLKVNVKVKAPAAKPFIYDTILTDRWVRINGEWYHVPGNKDITQANN